MNYTSIEQSRKLQKLGLDPKTADCSYCLKGTNGEKLYYSSPDWYTVEDDTDIPCWSVGSLIKLLPDDLMVDNKIHDPILCHLMLSKGGVGYYSSYNEHKDRSYTTCWGENPDLIDALYNCVVWLLENDYLNNKS